MNIWTPHLDNSYHRIISGEPTFSDDQGRLHFEKGHVVAERYSAYENAGDGNELSSGADMDHGVRGVPDELDLDVHARQTMHFISSGQEAEYCMTLLEHQVDLTGMMASIRHLLLKLATGWVGMIL